MILDGVENWTRYFSPEGRMASAFGFISGVSVEDLPDGRYPVDGEDVYAVVSSYETAPSSGKFPESHKRYIDVQIILEGEETIGWLPVEGLDVKTPYSEKDDIVFYRDGSGSTDILLRPGLFAVFYPWDAHKPGCASGKTSRVKKAVLKVRV